MAQALPHNGSSGLLKTVAPYTPGPVAASAIVEPYVAGPIVTSSLHRRQAHHRRVKYRAPLLDKRTTGE